MANRIVMKALAGIEDLLLGTGEVTQVRSGTDHQITKIDAAGLIYENAETMRTRFGKKVEVLTNVAALQILDTTNAAEVYVYLLGYTTAGDGGGGLFWLDSSDTSTVEDLNIVFNPDVLANGRWKRVDTDSYMSPDRGNANYTIQAFDYGIQQYNTTLTANRTVTLPTTGLYKGKRISVLRLAAGAFNLLIGSTTILTGTGLVELQYTGSTWIVLSEPTSSSSEGDSFNGSFEFDSNNDNLPDNWAINELVSATIEIDKTSQAHGANSLKFLSGGNGGGSVISERFDVLSGSILPIQFTYKSSVVDSLNTVKVNTYDKDGTLLSTLSAYSEGTANPLVYTTYNKSVAIDATAVTAELIAVGVDATSTNKAAGVNTHFDDIVINKRDWTDRFIFDTVWASTSGASHDFNVPSWAKKITVLFNEVSLSVASTMQIQLGDIDGIDTSGYNSVIGSISTGGTSSAVSTTTDIYRVILGIAAMQLSGSVVLTNLNDNTWIANGNLAILASDTGYGSGAYTLPKELTTIRITATAGVYDNGQINVLYEG